MSDNATIETTTPSTSTSSMDSLSAGERAYFESGGMDTSGLGGGTEGGLPAAPSEPASELGTAPPEQATEDDELAIEIGEDGRARDKVTGKFVPHAALHKERVRRQTVETELATYRDRVARMEARWETINELANKPDAPAADGTRPAAAAAEGKQPASDGKSPFDEPPIDPEEDIFAAFKQVQRQNAELVRLMKEGEQAKQQQQQVSGLRSAYEQDATAFMQKTPDFRDAYEHLIGGLHRELEIMGVSDEGQRNAAIAEKERGLVEQAMAAKKSPSELIYNLAKTRGFAGKAQAAPQQNATARLENIKKGQNSVVSLSRAGGSSSEGLTREVFANMTEAQFQQTIAKLSKEQLRAMMGG
jgi:hypothetical protein